MGRRLAGDLVIATHNPGKVREFAVLLQPFGITPAAASDLGLPEPVEDGDSFVANARIKAVAAATAAGRPALADDSGLEVDALGGAPGIHSARWAGPAKDFAMAMARVHRELGDRSEPAAAHFTAALVLAWPDGQVAAFEGHVHGTLTWPPRGRHGFGYDPMFIAAGQTLTFGEMDPAAKHAISHRAAAFRQLADACL